MSYSNEPTPSGLAEQYITKAFELRVLCVSAVNYQLLFAQFETNLKPR